MALSAPVTRVNGRIIGEKRGGVMQRFSHDPQGNTVASYNSSGTKTDSFVYWPHGEVRTMRDQGQNWDESWEKR